MSLRKIDLTQIDSSNVPDGYIIDIGKSTTPINSLYATNIYLTGTSIYDLLTSINNPDNVTAASFDPSHYKLTLINKSNSITPIDLSILATDMTVTGGTYDPNNGTVTFTNNSGGTFSVSGFTVGYTDIYVSGGTFNNNSLILSNTDGSTVPPITGLSEHVLYNTKISSGTTVVTTIGGITGGTKASDLSGKTIIELLDKILFPTTYPSRNSPTNNLLLSPNYTNNLFEIDYSSGTTINLILTDSYTQNQGGSVITYNFYGDSISGVHSQSSPNTYSFTLTATTATTYNFYGTVTYTAGTQQYDSTGSPYLTPIPSGTTSPSQKQLEGVYPIYWTKTNVNSSPTSDGKKILSFSKITYGSGLPNSITTLDLADELSTNVHAKFWIPKDILKNTFKIYHADLSNVYNQDETGSWTNTLITINGLDYYQYVYNGNTRGPITIQINF